MKTRQAVFRCPMPEWTKLKRRKSEDTKGLVRMIQQGLELDDIVEGLGDDLDQFCKVLGYDRATVIRECIRGMIQLAAAPEGQTILPLVLEEYAVGLKREAGQYRLDLIDAEPAQGFRSKAMQKRTKAELKYARERVDEAEHQAEKIRVPFVRATPEVLRILP